MIGETSRCRCPHLNRRREPGRGRNRTSGEAKSHLQSLSPVPTVYCGANIADLPTPVDEGGGYAYNIWLRYECPLDVGVLVLFIPFRYCFG